LVLKGRTERRHPSLLAQRSQAGLPVLPKA
jgi:hypothetical protein